MSKEETQRTERNRDTERTQRVPFGGMRLKLSIDEETKKEMIAKGLVPRWFNDVNHGQNLREAEEGGWNFVNAKGTEKVGTNKKIAERDRRMRRLVGTNVDGTPIYAFLMAIKKEWHEEDRARREQKNKMVDDAINKGEPQGVQHHGLDPKMGGSYVKNINYDP